MPRIERSDRTGEGAEIVSPERSQQDQNEEQKLHDNESSFDIVVNEKIKSVRESRKASLASAPSEDQPSEGNLEPDSTRVVKEQGADSTRLQREEEKVQDSTRVQKGDPKMHASMYDMNRVNIFDSQLQSRDLTLNSSRVDTPKEN